MPEIFLPARDAAHQEIDEFRLSQSRIQMLDSINGKRHFNRDVLASVPES